MLLRIIKVANGNGFTPVKEYSCDECSKKVNEADPHYLEKNKDFHLCIDCAFIKGFASEKQMLNAMGLSGAYKHVAFYNGEFHVWNGKLKPWEKPDSHYRRTKEYRVWRKKVFERDGYKCMHCGSETNLQAHHIKPFKNHVKLRYVVSNGISLCVTCHRAEHKRLKSGVGNERRCVSNK